MQPKGYKELRDVMGALGDHHTKLCDIVVDESLPVQQREQAQFLADNILSILMSLGRVKRAMEVE